MSRTKRIKIKTGEALRDGKRQRPAGSCNNHGGCPLCEGNRLHKYRRKANLDDDPRLSWEWRRYCGSVPVPERDA